MFLVCDRKGTSVAKETLLKLVTGKRLSAKDIIDWDAAYATTPLEQPSRAKPTLERAQRAIAELGRKKPFIIVYYGSDYAGGWQTLDAPLRTVTTVDRFALVTWEKDVPYMRMLQPNELSKAMGGGTDHKLPHGTRREKVKLCGNGVCSDVMTAIFKWIGSNQTKRPRMA
jgi:DNA (cytosine-5)-methyltransferase 1